MSDEVWIEVEPPIEDEQEQARRGLAGVSPERRREIAALGGRAAHEQGRAHEFTPEEARAAGALGGSKVSRDRKHMAEIGRKGGATSSKDRERMREIGRRGGLKVSENREHMKRIGSAGGKKGGRGR